MRDYLLSEWLRFKFELKELFTEWKEAINGTMNGTTYVFFYLVVGLGFIILASLLSIIPGIKYTQTAYDIIYNMGLFTHIAFFLVISIMRLNYYNASPKVIKFVLVMIGLTMVYLGNEISTEVAHITINGTEYIWPVNAPVGVFVASVLWFILLLIGPQYVTSYENPDDREGIIVNGKVIDTMYDYWWESRADLTQSQVDSINHYYDKYDWPLWVALNKGAFIDSLFFEGRTTRRSFWLYSFYIMALLYQLVFSHYLAQIWSLSLLYTYVVYTALVMLCRRLRDANRSIFWLLVLPIPLVNLYLVYVLYHKTSVLYDKETNSTFYYDL